MPRPLRRRPDEAAGIVSSRTQQPKREASFRVGSRASEKVGSLSLSARDRHALKWHLNPQQPKARDEARYLDRVWVALALDDVESAADENPLKLSAEKKAYEVTRGERDALFWFLDKPKVAAMSRLLRDVDRQIISSRNAEEAA